MIRLLFAAVLAVTLSACLASYDQVPFEVTVVDAESFEPVPNADVHVRYSSEGVANYPAGVDIQTGADGSVEVMLLDWGNTYLQSRGTRYHVYSCGAPRGWYHPDGFEFGEGYVEQGGGPYAIPPDRPLPATIENQRPVAIHLRALAALSPGRGIAVSCAFEPRYPAP